MFGAWGKDKGKQVRACLLLFQLFLEAFINIFLILNYIEIIGIVTPFQNILF
jgi:hypothetical protein